MLHEIYHATLRKCLYSLYSQILLSYWYSYLAIDTKDSELY